MKSKHINNILPDFLEGNLDKEREQEVRDHLKECEQCRYELEQYRVLEDLFEKEEEIAPSGRLEEKFSAMLEEEKTRNRGKESHFPFRRILQVAAAVAALFLSFQAGRLLEQEPSGEIIVDVESQEKSDERVAMLALLTEESASKRIQGVNYFEEANDLDKDILKVLVNKMLTDENTNVRLAAVEALGKYSNSEEVKKNLLTALKTEKDPVIQISLIQTLVKIKEKEAVEPMQKLLQNEETQPFVKEQIKALLPSII